MSTVETLPTAEEYDRLPDDGQPTELVRGVSKKPFAIGRRRYLQWGDE
jgi:hypothetical protein